MSGARVFRLRLDHDSVVVKASSSGREALFYARVAPRLRPIGVPIPDLLWSARAEGEHWLVLEDIPTPLPVPAMDLWQPDPAMVAVLARLHAHELDLPSEPFSHDGWRWTDAVTDAALSFFAPAVAASLTRPLRALQEQAQHLAEPRCWISGDPNPTNWGLRGDGSLALMDWELFRRGHPALDLAILIVGLGDGAKYERLAGCYVDQQRATGHLPAWPADMLARDIPLAKIWSVTVLLSTTVTGKGRVPDRLKAQLAEFVPPWIHQIGSTARPR